MEHSKKVQIQFSLPVSIFKEGRYFVAHTPILDLSTSGKSYEEVKKRFEEVPQIFFEELMEKGTLDKVLSDLGWSKVQKQWTPPTPIVHETVNFKLPISI